MPTPLTPAPIQEKFVNNALNSQAWVTWFQLMWRYVRGFSAESTLDTTLEINTTYYANSSSLVNFTLPARFNKNDVIQIIGKGSGGWKILQNAGQTIHGTSSTTTGVSGSLASSSRYNTVTLKGLTDNTELSVVSYTGVLTYT